MNQVILVDENDIENGTMEKLEAHQKGLLHRAISVFIVNSNGKWLLQQRNHDKYHSKGLWTNTCCSHPAPGEDTLMAANRRLQQEMGLSADLREIFSFQYKEKLEDNLTENEIDHVFIGVSDADPFPDKNEVVDFKHIDYRQLSEDIEKNPQQYTAWFKLIHSEVEAFLQRHLIGK